jgi:hypothetical protein
MKKEHEIFEDEFEPSNMEVTKHESGSYMMQKLSIDDIDELDKAEAAPIELSSSYWTPKLPGEQRKVIFDRIDVSLVPSAFNADETIELECAFFIVKENGAVKQICNGSKRLVGTLQSYNIQKGTALQITYEGKVKNKNNNFSSDSWSVVPLIIKK